MSLGLDLSCMFQEALTKVHVPDKLKSVTLLPNMVITHEYQNSEFQVVEGTLN